MIESVSWSPAGPVVVVDVRLDRRRRRCCGRCGAPAPGYDQGRGSPRCWRGLDAGTARVWLRSRVPRVRCHQHGVTAAAVPWARHGSRMTRAFEDTLAWLATRAAKTTIAALMRTSWRSVGQAVTRVVAELDAAGVGADRLVGLRRVGIDEVSYRRGHKYLTVVVDHDTGRLVYAADGRTKRPLPGSSTPCRATAASGCWCPATVRTGSPTWSALRAPNAKLCLDPFHVVATAQRALDRVRAAAAREARRRGDTGRVPGAVSGPVRAVEEPATTTAAAQAAKLAWVAAEHDKVHRAWQLKEHLRAVFAAGGAEGIALLDTWFDMAENSELPAFADYARRLRRYRKTSPTPCTPAWPTPASRAPTPSSGCSPESPSASTAPNP